MISDGAPSATGYDGENAREHVWEVVREGKKRELRFCPWGLIISSRRICMKSLFLIPVREITTKISQWIRKKFMSITDDNSF